MTEEIKETLEDVKRHLDYVEATKQCSIRDNEMKVMYDYITNLQKSQETLIKNDNEIITNLQEENERLREDLKYTVPQVEHNQIVTKLCKEKQDYKSICEKIKEYLEKHILFMREGSAMALFEIDEIFNILQGSDKE